MDAKLESSHLSPKIRQKADIRELMSHPPFHGEQGYLDLLALVKNKGADQYIERMDTYTRYILGQQLNFDLAEGYPLLTTKFVSFPLLQAELLWFIDGGSNEPDRRLSTQRLLEITNQALSKPTDRTIWDQDYDAPSWQAKKQFEGDVGRVYGSQWRSFRGPNGEEVDQLANVIDELKKNKYSRRAVVSAWNPAEMGQMVLPPCHFQFQVGIFEEELVMQMTQRSADLFLGLPFNIASYGLLAHILGHVIGVAPRWLQINIGDAHIYHDHFDQVDEQLQRTPSALPNLVLNPEVRDIDRFSPADIRIEGYQHQGAIKAAMNSEKR